ncbi:hypothetical protein KP509_35G064800 [Ceratopteris richardii]|uniref:Pentatricopeptide repeat-containing protein n=1 Tax=Ceratopteris richardii TaxID=49495 RepID=A0A8T2QG85_CERRI|nr:hypothetical protein KP509_35G064800 [Ceratopteris richardii]KAH7283168.1 hypothetical protein KP509_35G064800 [Ceratopteris richardii]KAH7283169.1 hypothetical protein KP509_35G064800 [Ceratopteris richardii]KAH7283170.1 hypothetical protein KP509_35G064800 [Ceratopteris richardii]KAH7283171.1 hypothetical protein KP509_35G064800 [Ceratopteris richardii]
MTKFLNLWFLKKVYLKPGTKKLWIHTSSHQVKLDVLDYVHSQSAGIFSHGKGASCNVLSKMQAQNYELLQRYQDDIYFERQTLLVLLRAAGKLRNAVLGQELHAMLIKQGNEDDCIASSTVVHMYGECGLLTDARCVLNDMPYRNAISWTSLILAYTNHGFAAKALECMKLMRLEQVIPNPVTFICSLRACGDIRTSTECLGIHSEITKRGFDKDPLLGSVLVDTYSKCIHLLEAQKVVDSLPYVDSITLTPLLVGYAECGFLNEAKHCWGQIIKNETIFDKILLKCGLKACVYVQCLNWGREIHVEIIKRGVEEDLPVCNALVDMYIKCCSYIEAESVFDQIPIKDVVSWNTILHGFGEHDLVSELHGGLELMRHTGVSPTAVTYVCCLKACENVGFSQKLHIEVNKLGLERNIYIASAIVDIYSKFGLFTDALKVFNNLSNRNSVSWTALISGYADHSLGEEVMYFLARMLSEGVPVDAVTIICCLKVCGDKAALIKGQLLHTFVTSEGLERHPCISNMLVGMYTTCGLLQDAHNVCNALFAPSVSAWTSLIVGYASNGLNAEALSCLQTIHLEGLPMDPMTFSAILKVCGNIGVVCEGLKLHMRIVQEGVERESLVGNALVDFYAKCGFFVEAQNVFSKLSSASSVSWTVLITAYACQGRYLEVFRKFYRMMEQGLEPDKVTFLSLLTTCSHVGLVDEGLKYFACMWKGYGIAPNMDHINSMLDIFSRAGQLNNASFILDKMPFQPDISTWHTILSACRKWGDVELARQAFDSALMLGENHYVALLVMLSIYIEADL